MEEMDFFKSVEKIGVKGDFQFFFLTDYADGIDHFSAEAQATFRELESYLPELRESIEISLPDEEAVLDEEAVDRQSHEQAAQSRHKISQLHFQYP